MSGSPARRRSARFAVASVTPIAVPSGSRKQLRARRGREELLLDQTERGYGAGEQQDREGNDRLAPAQAPSDHAAQRAIDARVIDRVRVVVRAELGKIGQ